MYSKNRRGVELNKMFRNYKLIGKRKKKKGRKEVSFYEF